MKKNLLSRFFLLAIGLFIFQIQAQAQATIAATEPTPANFYAVEALFGPDLAIELTAPLRLLNDGDDSDSNGDGIPGSETDGCEAAQNDLTGVIALLDRGECIFVDKALNAQAGGALAVIICNNDEANPTDLFLPGGDDMGQVTIPVLGINFNTCQILKNDYLESTVTLLPSPNVLCAEATPIEPGTYVVDTIVGDPVFGNNLGFGATDDDADFAVWYSFTPSTSGVAFVNSCLGGSDTNLKIHKGVCAITTTGGLQLVADSDDACPFIEGIPDNWASAAQFFAQAGTTYYIEWNNRWSSEGFTFNLVFQEEDYEPVDNEVCEMATEVMPGIHTVDMITGFGANASNTLGSAWYSFTPTESQMATITSCDLNNETNTRVLLYEGTCDELVFIAESDNFCGLQSQIGPMPVNGGTTYYIEWAGTFSTNGFDWELKLEPFPMVDITISVDMSQEEVASGGVFLGYAPTNADGFEDVTIIPMTDNGDDTWTVTFQTAAFDTIGYAFANGTPDIVMFSNIEQIPEECSFPTIFGFRARPLIVNNLNGIEIDAVCYESCDACPPDVSCPNWIQDDFESYTLGGISAQSPDWTTWTPDSPGEDSNVSDAFASSGVQALEISATDPDDMLLRLGDRTAGNFILKWKMYVPTGNGAYYNIQKEQDNPGGEFGAEIVFNTDGTGAYNVGGTALPFSYPHDTWFEVYQSIDIDNDAVTVWVNGETAATHPLSYQAGGTTGTQQLGAIDFFGLSSVNTLYYIDDVLFKEVETCVANALICDGLDGYNLGNVGPQSPHWIPWNLEDNTPEDGEVTHEQFLSCEQSLLISEANGDDMLLRLGDRTEGNYSLSWDYYIPEGASGYFNVQKMQDNPGGEFGIQVEFFADGSGTLDAGASDVFTFDFPHDTWFNVLLEYDLDNNIAHLTINGTPIFSWPANWQAFDREGLLQLGAVNFFGNTNVTQYIDNVLFIQAASVIGNVCSGANDLSQLFGQGLNNPQTSDVFDNTGFSTTDTDPDIGYECFGEPDGGGASPSLENTIWFSFVGDGETYYIETGNCDAVTDYIDDGDTQMAIYSGDCDNLTPIACNEDSDNAVVGNFISGLEIATELGVTYYMMIDGFNFNGAISDGQFCLNVEQLTAPVPVMATFHVDASLIEVAAEGLFISGSFAGWPDPGSAIPMTDDGDNTWSVTVEVPGNSTVEYKFQNGTDPATAWENIDTSFGDDCVTGDFNNRFIVVADEDVELDLVCFNYCVACEVVGTQDAVFPGFIQVFPNPAKDITHIQYQLEETVDLTLHLTNTLGQLVQSRQLKQVKEGTHVIDIAQLPSGVYLLELTDGVRHFVQTLVVE